MAGHSKWANIKHRKARMDAQKGKIFTKLSREISVAARQGGGNIETNFNLRLAVEKARNANMPNENIMRAIQRGTGELEGVNYEEVNYEGYGPGGVALLINVLTDNRNRTTAEIRNILSRNGGSLGETGCVSWMFERKGYITLEKDKVNLDEDDLMLLAIEAGAEDMKTEDNTIVITCAPEDFEDVRNNLEEQKLPINVAEVSMVPSNTVIVNDPGEARKVLHLVEALEEHNDVQNVYANFDISEEIMLSEN